MFHNFVGFFVQKISPPLHHLSSLIEKLCMVHICSTNFVAFDVRELPFNGIGIEAFFIEDRRSIGAEAMRSGS